MSSELYLVTGATGATGRSAINHLLSRGAEVRAFVHNDDDRAAALRANGVEVVFGDLLDNADPHALSRLIEQQELGVR